MQDLGKHIEALIFANDQPITLKEIRDCLEEFANGPFEEGAILAEIGLITNKYHDPDMVFQLQAIGGGYQFLTKTEFHDTIAILLKQNTKRRLSTSALETLAIIAYKQPVTKSEIESIRGVNCDYAVGKLLDKDLVTINGKSDAPGRPLIYGTSESFLNYFGINSVNDLPSLKDIQAEEELPTVNPEKSDVPSPLDN